MANEQQETGYPLEFKKTGSDELDLAELFRILWSGKWLVMGITFVFAVFSVWFALSLPNIYEANTKLAPTEESTGGGLSGLASQLGGIAGLTGMSMNRQGENSTMAVEVLRSREFIKNFVERHDILPDLMAVESWDPITRELTYDREKYNPDTGQWVREVDPPFTPEPSAWEYVHEFRTIFIVERDDLTGFTTLRIQHQSPVVAAQWVRWLVQDINDEIRSRSVNEANRSIEYLEQELSKTNLSRMQQIFYQLIEQQVQTIMLANARPEYVFRTIDPPVEPEEKVSPSRALICIAITLFGGLFSVFVVFGLHMYRATRNKPVAD